MRLTPKEFDLFVYMARHPNRVLTHRGAARGGVGPGVAGAARVPARLHGQLRKKLEPDPSNPRYLVTEPWVGYRFNPKAIDGGAEATVGVHPGRHDGQIVIAAAALAQFGGRGPFRVRNIPYDGRFTFVRIKYTPAPGGNWAGGRPSWVHGYPVAEQNLMRIMKELSFLDAHTDDMNVVTLDDPELFHYPVAYIIEVGWWTMTDRRSRRRCARISRKAGS